MSDPLDTYRWRVAQIAAQFWTSEIWLRMAGRRSTEGITVQDVAKAARDLLKVVGIVEPKCAPTDQQEALRTAALAGHGAGQESGWNDALDEAVKIVRGWEMDELDLAPDDARRIIAKLEAAKLR